MTKKPRQAKFCGRLCSHRAQTKPAGLRGHRKVCEQCGIVFQTRNLKKKRCGAACMGIAYRRRATYRCIVCGKVGEAALSSGDRRYCSQGCHNIGQSLHLAPRPCLHCKENYVPTVKHRKVHVGYCTYKCSVRAHGGFVGACRRIPCLHCGNSFRPYGRDNIFCSTDCVYAFKTGKFRAVTNAQVEIGLLNRVKTLLDGAEVIGSCL